MVKSDGGIVIYGSAFNPIHYGHLDAIDQLLANFDKVWVVPCATHPFGKDLLPFTDRLQLVSTALQNYHSGAITVSDIEQQLLQQLPQQTTIYTYDLLAYIGSQLQTRISVAFGPDNLLPQNWQRFYRYSDIEQQFAIYPLQQRKPIRSTICRTELQRFYRYGDNQKELQRLMPAAVVAQITAHRWFAET